MDASKHQGRWSGIIGTGQSLGVGIQAPLPGMTQPVPHALKLHDPTEPWQAKYNIDKPGNPALKVVPLNEPIHAVHPDAQPPLAYPWNIAGKTPHSAMATQITALLKERGQPPITTVHSCVARSGEAMQRIHKGGGTNAYKASMYEAEALTRIAKQDGQRLEYDAIILTHGETDAGFGNKEYEQQLFAFHKDYIQDLQRITGQQHPPLLIMSQQNTCPTDPRDARPSPVIQAQWRAQLHAPRMMICAGPKYQYGYHPDGLHFPGPSYDRLGEKYGQVFFRTVIEGEQWLPLSPREITFREPSTVHVAFNVPIMPLQWDERLWPPHQKTCREWCEGRGFELRDSHGRTLAIKGVQINQDRASVSIQLASSCDHFPLALSYAMGLDDHGTCGGRPGGRVGHLCDSDSMVGAGAEKIKVRAQQGSNQLRCCTGRFVHRAKFDLVESGHYSITSFDDAWERNVAFLDRAWDGPTGEFELFFQHNHRNYCVGFAAWVRKQGFTFDIGDVQASQGAPAQEPSTGGFRGRLHGLFRG